jgi:hypothetical protein
MERQDMGKGKDMDQGTGPEIPSFCTVVGCAFIAYNDSSHLFFVKYVKIMRGGKVGRKLHHICKI